MRMSSGVVCGFSQNCAREQAPTGGSKAVHMNQKRFGGESNLITEFIWLVWSIWFVWFIELVWFNQTNETN
jgi:hypothetical protein